MSEFFRIPIYIIHIYYIRNHHARTNKLKKYNATFLEYNKYIYIAKVEKFAHANPLLYLLEDTDSVDFTMGFNCAKKLQCSNTYDTARNAIFFFFPLVKFVDFLSTSQEKKNPGG